MEWNRNDKRGPYRVIQTRNGGAPMTLLLAIALPAIIAAVFLGAAYVWRNEVNAVLRRIERY